MEKPVQFSVNGKRLFGILHVPEQNQYRDLAVLMIIGGPQTRVGSHRLFTLLARNLCNSGIAVMRFDYEGLGDSEGDFVGFTGASPSIDAAIRYCINSDYKYSQIILWTICDGAEPAIFTALKNKNQISGLILCNPYFVSAMGDPQDIQNHYAKQTPFHREFWNWRTLRKLNVSQVWKKTSVIIKKSIEHFKLDKNDNKSGELNLEVASNFIKKFHEINRPLRFILSSEDLVAMRFTNVFNRTREMKRMIRLKKVKIKMIENSDHTFTEPDSLNEVFHGTLDFIDDINQKSSTD